MKETIYMKQKVILEYDTPKDRQEVIAALKRNPNCLSYGGSIYGFTKAEEKIKIIIQKRTPIKPPNK